MNIMMVGDVVGRPGRIAFAEHTGRLKKEKNIDMVVVNGENAAHGKGLTSSTFNALLSGGADVVTSGNHIWDQKDIFNFIDREPFLLRPANYPENTPGKGFCVYPYKAKNIGVINLQGRSFMQPLDCPFSGVETVLKEISRECDIILVDFHAETTSEKIAMAYFLDGRVSAVVGTHTHVQTADERIFPGGTAYITDLGMVGALNSVLGVKPEQVLEKFLTARPTKFEIPDPPCRCIYSALIIKIDDSSNKVVETERIYEIED